MTSFHSFSIVAFASGINIPWVERSFIHTSRFPEACVCEREISRVFWTIRNSRFPKFADQNHIRSSYFFHLRFTLESISYSPDFWGLVEECCLTDTLCRETRQHAPAFTLKKYYVKRFLQIFSSERICAQSCHKVQNSVLPCNIKQNNWTFFFASDV